MYRRLLFFAVAMTVATAALFFTGYRFNNLKNFAASLGVVTNFQNNASTTPKNNSGASSTPTLTDVLRELQNQGQLLANQVVDLRSQLEIIDLRTIFSRIMKRGDSGDDVKKLQGLLAKIPKVYNSEANPSDIVTGYYGNLTQEAVTRFQLQEGLRQTGIVDQNTKEKLIKVAANLAIDNSAVSKFIPINLSTVAGLQNITSLQNQTSANPQKITDLQTQISQLVSNASTTQTDISNLQSQTLQITSDISSIQQNISDIQSSIAKSSLPPPPPTSPTPPPPALPPPPPPPALAISNIQATGITRVSAVITWTTNNLSTSEVDYSKSSSLTSPTLASSSVMATSHSLTLSSLSSATKYYYRVVSKDSNNSVASSTILSFITLQ